MSSFLGDQLPSLDCHAHIAPDVTIEQVHRLGGSFVFAMTRSLSESEQVRRLDHPSLVWGCGVHPGSPEALRAYDQERFSSLLDDFPLVGEVGLDRRSGNITQQAEVLESVLRTVRGRPVLLSLHSAGREHATLELLAANPHPGAILHWFLGDGELVRLAEGIGCYFSVNAAMADGLLELIPPDRMLPETDFPSSRQRTRVHRPGDITHLEARVAGLLGLRIDEVRRLWYRNLRALAMASGTLDRLPGRLADYLVAI